MNWYSAFWRLIGEDALQARLVVLAWHHATLRNDPALIDALLTNALHPCGVCHLVDTAGIPLPPDIIQQLTQGAH